MVKDDPALARRLRKLRSKAPKAEKQAEVDPSKQGAKRAEPIKIKKKTKRRPNREWLAFNKKPRPNSLPKMR
jgi:hypothetical protein